MTERVVKTILLFIYTSITTWATGYAVFILGNSGWWFSLAVALIIIYAGLNTEVDKTKK
jgi:hypothetical protein